MKKAIILFLLIFLYRLASPQDTIININSFKPIPKINLHHDEILFKLIKDKAYDYWEFRNIFEIQSNDCPYDSIDCLPYLTYKYDVLAHGDYKNINDSIKLSKINCINGFWAILPTGTELYLITIKSNMLDSIVSREELFEFLKPFNSIEKIRLYFEHYIPLKFKQNNDNFEFIIYDTEMAFRYYENRRGHFIVFEKSYLRICNDGRFYKKRIGEYHLKVTKPSAIS